MIRDDVLVVEISGKRPGSKKQRPTEKFEIKHKHLIITNNCEGYETEWDIVEVPEEYRKYYIEKYKMHDKAYYAPMNRSYAIKYAREHGYKYCVQLDDNIKMLELSYIKMDGEIKGRYRTQSGTAMMDDFIDMLCTALDETNAAMAGMALCGVSPPSPDIEYLRERYCYSFFALKLSVCPDAFHGDFEDDIEYRLKCKQLGLPVIQIAPLHYSKVGQRSAKDESGCRAAYTEAGVSRGAHMRMLNGDIYAAGQTNRSTGIKGRVMGDERFFRHRLTPWRIGILVNDRKRIDEKMLEILIKNAPTVQDKYILKMKGQKEDEKGGVEGTNR